MQDQLRDPAVDGVEGRLAHSEALAPLVFISELDLRLDKLRYNNSVTVRQIIGTEINALNRLISRNCTNKNFKLSAIFFKVDPIQPYLFEDP